LNGNVLIIEDDKNAVIYIYIYIYISFLKISYTYFPIRVRKFYWSSFGIYAASSNSFVNPHKAVIRTQWKIDWNKDFFNSIWVACKHKYTHQTWRLYLSMLNVLHHYSLVLCLSLLYTKVFKLGYVRSHWFGCFLRPGTQLY
jgi:hypothetical protein